MHNEATQQQRQNPSGVPIYRRDAGLEITAEIEESCDFDRFRAGYTAGLDSLEAILLARGFEPSSVLSAADAARRRLKPAG